MAEREKVKVDVEKSLAGSPVIKKGEQKLGYPWLDPKKIVADILESKLDDTTFRERYLQVSPSNSKETNKKA